MIVGDQDANRLRSRLHTVANLLDLQHGKRGREDANQKLLVTGDNRLKQGVALEKARESYEQALAVAREAGLEDKVRPLVEIRLADLERLAAERGSE